MPGNPTGRLDRWVNPVAAPAQRRAGQHPTGRPSPPVPPPWQAGPGRGDEAVRSSTHDGGLADGHGGRLRRRADGDPRRADGAPGLVPQHRHGRGRRGRRLDAGRRRARVGGGGGGLRPRHRPLRPPQRPAGRRHDRPHVRPGAAPAGVGGEALRAVHPARRGRRPVRDAQLPPLLPARDGVRAVRGRRRRGLHARRAGRGGPAQGHAAGGDRRGRVGPPADRRPRPHPARSPPPPPRTGRWSCPSCWRSSTPSSASGR